MYVNFVSFILPLSFEELGRIVLGLQYRYVGGIRVLHSRGSGSNWKSRSNSICEGHGVQDVSWIVQIDIM